MHDMLRIMDVASALRRERETAEAQLDAATAKARLRDRLLATAAAAGEPVTPAEVDAAIAHYFAEQHRYADPPNGLKNFLAHCWVQRLGCVFLLILLGTFTLVAVLVANSVMGDPPAKPVVAPPPVVAPKVTPVPATPPPAPTPVVEAPKPTPRVEPPKPPVEDLATVWAKFQAAAAAAREIAADDVARASVDQVVKLGRLHHEAQNLERLRMARSELDEVATRLAEEYTVTIVDRSGVKSGFERLYNGRVSGYYLVVEALDRNGNALRRSIVNTETKSRDMVTMWGEEVELDVFERIVADKQKDGVVDENVVAKKVRGIMSEEFVLDDGRGKPIAKGRRVTKW
jgi:hypothetical protein